MAGDHARGGAGRLNDLRRPGAAQEQVTAGDRPPPRLERRGDPDARLSEADDAVQEAWLRLGRSDANSIQNLAGWLTTVVARISLDMLRARRSRSEEPVGTHVPDPIVRGGDSVDPEQEAEAMMADSISLALLVVLEPVHVHAPVRSRPKQFQEAIRYRPHALCTMAAMVSLLAAILRARVTAAGPNEDAAGEATRQNAAALTTRPGPVNVLSPSPSGCVLRRGAVSADTMSVREQPVPSRETVLM